MVASGRSDRGFFSRHNVLGGNLHRWITSLERLLGLPTAILPAESPYRFSQGDRHILQSGTLVVSLFASLLRPATQPVVTVLQTVSSAVVPATSSQTPAPDSGTAASDASGASTPRRSREFP